MNTRPRDICTAAFHGDTARLCQLIVAAGVYSNRWQPPCHIDTSPMARASIEDDLLHDDDAYGAEDGAGAAAAPAPLVSEDIADEMTEVLSEGEMAALLAHPELQRVTRAYALEADVEEEGDDDKAADDDDGAELFDEAEEAAAEADRQAQQQDLLAYRCLLAEQQHRASVAQRLQQHGFVQASTTPPVNMTPYGILFSCRVRAVVPHSAVQAGEAAEDTTSNPATVAALQVRWQPSKRSRYAGTPLHWAVLAREHDAVKFLIEHGADATAGLTLEAAAAVHDTPGKVAEGSGDNTETSASAKSPSSTAAAPPAAAAKVLSQLTPAAMAAANESLPTLQVLEDALAARASEAESRTRFVAALEGRMQRRKERYVRRRQIAVARRALQAQAQQAEEEAEEARARAEEAAAEDGDGEEDYAGGDDEEPGDGEN